MQSVMQQGRPRALVAALGAALALFGAGGAAVRADAGPAPQVFLDQQCLLRAAFVDAPPGPTPGFALSGTLRVARAIEGPFAGTLVADGGTIYPVSGHTAGSRVELNVAVAKDGVLRATGNLTNPRAGVCGGAAGDFTGPQPSLAGTWSAEPRLVITAQP